MTGKDVVRMACAVLVGAALAFPAGMMFAGREVVREREGPAVAGTAGARKFYSPVILKDPYVLDQHRRVVEALELQCRHYRERCAEAEQARRWMNNVTR